MWSLAVSRSLVTTPSLVTRHLFYVEIYGGGNSSDFACTNARLVPGKWCTRHASTIKHSIYTRYVLCGFQEGMTQSPILSSGWLWWTWDILCTWLTCWPNCTGNISLRSMPKLFNILAEMVMRKTVDGFQGGLQIGGWITFATLMTSSC